MSEFELRTWELPIECEAPLDAPADAESEIEWRGAKVTAKFRLVEVEKGKIWLFVQPQDKWANNYVVCRNYGDAWPPQIQLFSGQESQRLAARATSRTKCFTRFIHLNVPEKPVAIFSEHWNGWHYRHTKITPFSVPVIDEQMKSSFLYEWLKQEWEKPTSEIQFAYQWMQRDGESRGQFLKEARESVEGRKEELVESKEVVRLVTILESQLTTDMEWFLGTRSIPSSVSPAEQAGFPDINPDVNLLSRLENWRKVLVRHFPVFRTLDDDAPLCLHRACEGWLMISAQGQHASAHEQIEAAIQLGEWLRDKVSEVEAASLLKQNSFRKLQN